MTSIKFTEGASVTITDARGESVTFTIGRDTAKHVARALATTSIKDPAVHAAVLHLADPQHASIAQSGREK